MKKNIFVFFGGVSAEHDISIITAIQTLNAADKTKYDIFPAYIDKTGLFWTGDKLFDLKTYINFDPIKSGLSRISVLNGEKKVGVFKRSKIKKTIDIDAAVLCCHGAGGEDGGLQGLLEMSDIPYSSSNVCASAVCMNKKVMKDVFLSHKLPIVEHISTTREEFEQNPKSVLLDAKKIGYPLIAKPANCGSSIGISKCKTEEELKDALALAFEFDGLAVIEKCIENLLEVNCAVLKVGNTIITSVLEEPQTKSDILSFSDKYLSSPKKGDAHVLCEKDIKLKKSQKELTKALARESFLACGCDGVARIDFLFDRDTQKIYVNEINTIPGSLSNYLFSEQMNFSELVDNLIESALQKHKTKHKNTYNFSSPAILSYLGSGTKRNKV